MKNIGSQDIRHNPITDNLGLVQNLTISSIDEINYHP